MILQKLARPIGGAIVDDDDQSLVVIGPSKLTQYPLRIGEPVVDRYYDCYAGRSNESHTDLEPTTSATLTERFTPAARDARSIECVL